MVEERERDRGGVEETGGNGEMDKLRDDGGKYGETGGN